ncbi:MAG: energy transducer TonB, partial [Methylomonas sp.]
AQQSNAFFAGLLGEERTESMLILLFILVLLLHVWLIIFWRGASENVTTPPVPLMQVSMLTVSAPKSPASVTPPPIKEKTPEPKKTPVKPAVKKQPAIVQKPADLAPAEKAVETEKTVSESAPAQTAAANKQPATATEQTMDVYSGIKPQSTPKPKYPAVAKNRGWEGVVKLKIYVSAQGLVDKVEIVSSSGHEMLDEAAMEEIKTTWRFAPAKRGDTPIADSTQIPIRFRLDDSDQE